MPPECGPAKTIYNRYRCWAGRGIWQRIFAGIAAAGAVPNELMLDSSVIEAHRSASSGRRREWAQAIGISRGERTTKIHCLADARDRIVALVLTRGNVADITVAAPLVEAVAPTKRLIADGVCDADHLRDRLRRRGTKPVIPDRGSCNVLYPLNRHAYRCRDVTERMFGPLENWRRIATRCDRLAETYPAAIAKIPRPPFQPARTRAMCGAKVRLAGRNGLH